MFISTSQTLRQLCLRKSTYANARAYALKAAKLGKSSNAGVPQAISRMNIPKVSSNIRHAPILHPEQARRQYAAKKIYEQGFHAIYRAPSHIGVLSVSWLLGFTFVGATAALGWLGHWNDKQNEGMSSLQAMVVGVAYRLGMIFFTCVGAVAVLRYKGLVTALDLVPHGDTVKLRVTVRRAIPFLKPKQYVVPPYDFRVPYKWILPLEDPAWLARKDAKAKVDLNPLRAIGNFFYTPFKSFRTYVLRDGIMRVRFENEDKTALLDTSGWFSNDGKDFLEVTTTEEKWKA